MAPWVIIGNPENRRVQLFQAALRSLGLPHAMLISYEQLLDGSARIDQFPRNAFVRIDSPGENFRVERGLLQRGIDAVRAEGGPCLDAAVLEKLSVDRGRILHPRQWYLGFCELLNELNEELEGRPDLRLCQSAREIIDLFDKTVCHERCLKAGIPVPHAIDAISCFEELAERMTSLGMSRVFVKLAHGSSASGVVALLRTRHGWAATTSAELCHHDGELRVYNSLKIRSYTVPLEVDALINWLIPHRVHIEQWLPRATTNCVPFDTRVVVIDGKPSHIVVRTSKSPMTNLHLGNRRGHWDDVRQRLSPLKWTEFEETCRKAAACYPNATHLGLDILWSPGFRKHFLLETNAFGDLLPNVLIDGYDTYQAQILSRLAKCNDC